MSPLLQQFVSETRDLLQSISEQLLEVEKADDKQTTLNELFRIVHTLKGNTGLFEFPDLTRVLHAGEDVMSEARERPEIWDQALTDLLFESMDYVSSFCDSLEENNGEPVSDSKAATQLSKNLRAYLDGNNSEANAEATDSGAANEPQKAKKAATKTKKATAQKKSAGGSSKRRPPRAKGLPPEHSLLKDLPVDTLIEAWKASNPDEPVWLVKYSPLAECFFQGDDPLHTARSTPGVLWGKVENACATQDINDLDPYQCVSTFTLLSNASEDELHEHYRYVTEQTDIEELSSHHLLLLSGDDQNDALPEDTVDALCDAVEAMQFDTASGIATTALELLNKDLQAAAALRWVIAITSDTDAQENEAKEALIVVCQRLRHNQHLSGYRFSEPEPDEKIEERKEEHEPEESRLDTYTESTTDLSGADTEDLLDALVEDDREAFEHIVRTQGRILELDPTVDWAKGRLRATCNVLIKTTASLGLSSLIPALEEAVNAALSGNTEPLADWINEVIPGACSAVGAGSESNSAEDESRNPDNLDTQQGPEDTDMEATDISEESGEENPDESSDESTADEAAEGSSEDTESQDTETTEQPEIQAPAATAPVETPAEKQTADKASSFKPEPAVAPSKSVKVDQEKIDRLMNLIGEMTVAKNALPFLAKRAEEQHGLRDLAREIKEQFAVVNRIAEEMQDSIMQIRMMPFSFISMRFPRLVRDISRRLNKDVQLVIEGEDTEADKNIIESLAEPLIHIVRNSLDHGIEAPDVRKQKGKPATGSLTIRASQEADRVMIEIQDDGKGIDPEVIRNKAFEKGLIDEATRQRLTDKEAVNLVLMPGFSTADEVSDLSGRGVGMDAVRSAVDKVNGTMALESQVDKGTRIRISLPMSIAVTRVMIIESDNQLMGIPMDQVLETVRVPRSDIHTVKHVKTTVLRDRIVPLKSLNELLALPAEQIINEEEEHAVLVARVGNDVIGLVVDDFRGSVDIIQKPMTGVLSGMQAYSGAALIGDGSVLMVLNLKEVL
ncbi:MAG: chemotaxis protein CheA [Thalassolituus maritimus]|nr:MAG: chemotaxis protein CheA [Thalassolituus maritimus]